MGISGETHDSGVVLSWIRDQACGRTVEILRDDMLLEHTIMTENNSSPRERTVPERLQATANSHLLLLPMPLAVLTSTPRGRRCPSNTLYRLTRKAWKRYISNLPSRTIKGFHLPQSKFLD